MNDKLVSVIIPCYNGENFIDRCAMSIYVQEYSRIEIIFVNDGSTDNSKQIIYKWKDKFFEKNYSLICVSQENRGLGGAINTGLKYVSGDYIILLDVDDELLSGAISDKVKYLEMHKDEDVVRANGWYIRHNGKSLFIYDQEEKEIQDMFSALLEAKTNNWAGSYMVRKSALFSFYPDRQIYESKYGQNLQMLLPLVYKKKCGYIDKPQMNYNLQEDSLSKTSNDSEKQKKSLENAKGYKDIRLYLTNLIVPDKEKGYYLDMIEIAYIRNIMRIAAEMKDKSLMRETYRGLKKLIEPTLDDRIKYCHLIIPMCVPGLRLFRKIKNICTKNK